MKHKTRKHSSRRKTLSFEDALARRAASPKTSHRKSTHSDHTAAEIAAEDGTPVGLLRFTDLETPII